MISLVPLNIVTIFLYNYANELHLRGMHPLRRPGSTKTHQTVTKTTDHIRLAVVWVAGGLKETINNVVEGDGPARGGASLDPAPWRHLTMRFHSGVCSWRREQCVATSGRVTGDRWAGAGGRGKAGRQSDRERPSGNIVLVQRSVSWAT